MNFEFGLQDDLDLHHNASYKRFAQDLNACCISAVYKANSTWGMCRE